MGNTKIYITKDYYISLLTDKNDNFHECLLCYDEEHNRHIIDIINLECNEKKYLLKFVIGLYNDLLYSNDKILLLALKQVKYKLKLSLI